MLSVIFALALVLPIMANTVVIAGNPDNDPEAKITWNEETHDFGTVKQKEPVKFEFKFENKFDEPVVISNVRSSCGCTVAGYDKNPILPGKEGSVKVTYNSAKVGKFRKTVAVTMSSGEKYVLTVKGEVKKKT